MRTELVGKWSTRYYSDDGKRCAVVEPCRVWDPDTAHCVETYVVGNAYGTLDFVEERSDSELGAHIIAQSWVNERRAT